MNDSLCHSCAVPHVNVQLAVVQEVLRIVDSVGDVIAARSPLPALDSQQSVPRVVTAALCAEFPSGAS